MPGTSSVGSPTSSPSLQLYFIMIYSEHKYPLSNRTPISWFLITQPETSADLEMISQA